MLSPRLIRKFEGLTDEALVYFEQQADLLLARPEHRRRGFHQFAVVAALSLPPFPRPKPAKARELAPPLAGSDAERHDRLLVAVARVGLAPPSVAARPGRRGTSVKRSVG